MTDDEAWTPAYARQVNRAFAKNCLYAEISAAVMRALEDGRITIDTLAERSGQPERVIRRAMGGWGDWSLNLAADLAWAIGCRLGVEILPGRTEAADVRRDVPTDALLIAAKLIEQQRHSAPE